MDVILKLQHKMTNKLYSFVLTTIFAILVFSVAVSALHFDTSSLTYSGLNNKTLNLISDENFSQQITMTAPSISGATFNLIPNPSAPFNLANFSSQPFVINLSAISGLAIGSYSTILNVTGTNASESYSNSISIPITINKGFCVNGDVGGNMTITRFRITNNGNGGTNDWKLLDTITVEVRVLNSGVATMNDVRMVLGLIDSSGNNVIGDVDFTSSNSEEIDIGDLGKNNDDTEDYTFQVPADFNDGSYQLVFKVYSGNKGESAECTDVQASGSSFQTITVDRESKKGKLISFDKINYPQEATCGDTVDVSFDAVNVGDSTQDRTLVDLSNKPLGLNVSQEIKQTLDLGDKKTIDFSFVVPQVSNGVYNLALTAFYDWRDNFYRDTLDDPTIIPLDIIGCGNTAAIQTIGISAVANDAAPGATSQIKATITNLGNATSSFAIGLANYDSWATIGSYSDRLVTLSPGQSKDVTINLVVNKNAVVGQQTATIQVISGANTQTQDVSINVLGSQSAFSNLFTGGNGILWIIAIINIILIIVIIIVAVRIARR